MGNEGGLNVSSVQNTRHDDCLLKGKHSGGINHRVIKKHSWSLRPEWVKNLHEVNKKICFPESMLKMNRVKSTTNGVIKGGSR